MLRKSLTESLRLADEKIDQLQTTITSEQAINKHLRERFDSFVNKCADLVGSPHDEESVIKFISNYDKAFEELDDLKIKYGKQTKKIDEEKKAYQEEIDDLLKRITKMEVDHQREINNLRIEHERQIKSIRKEVQGIKNDVVDTKQKEKKVNEILQFFRVVFSKFRK